MQLCRTSLLSLIVEIRPTTIVSNATVTARVDGLERATLYTGVAVLSCSTLNVTAGCAQMHTGECALAARARGLASGRQALAVGGALVVLAAAAAFVAARRRS